MNQKNFLGAASRICPVFQSRQKNVFGLVIAALVIFMFAAQPAEAVSKRLNIIEIITSKAARPSDLLAAKFSISPPSCELDYIPTEPISFSQFGGTGNFPIFNRNGAGGCPNPNVTLESGSPAIVTNIGGANSIMNNYQIFFRIAPNLTGAPRPINFNIYTDGVLTGDAQIIQTDGCAYSLGLETGATVFPPDGGQEELDIDISPDCSATNITSDVSWMRVSGTTLIVDPVTSSAAANADSKTSSAVSSATGKRTGTITVSGSGGVPVTMRISEGSVRKIVNAPARDKKKFMLRTRAGIMGVRG